MTSDDLQATETTEKAPPPPQPESPVDREHSKLAKIEGAIDREVGRGMIVAGSAKFANMLEVMEFAKLLATAQKAVPKHLRLNPGGCLAVTLQAMDWGMSPIALANKSYEVNDRIAYESQAIHAALEMSGKLQGRLKHTYIGEGPTRQCIVVGRIKGEDFDRSITSPMLKDIKVKNSPLWVSKPDVQLFYNTSRDWARIYTPEVLLGVYSIDELEEDVRAETARDITPGTGLVKRLSATQIEGYKPENVDQLAQVSNPADELANVAVDVDDGKAQPETIPVSETAPADPSEGTDKKSRKKDDKKNGPKNSEAYVAHLTAWLKEATDDAYIHDRYEEEKPLRTKCGVMGEDLTKCVQLKKERLTELGSV